MSVRETHKHIVESAILGWFLGLAYYNWFSSQPIQLSLLAHLILVTAVMYIVCILIASASRGIATLVAKAVSGFVHGQEPMFTLAMPSATVLGFLAAGYALVSASRL